jgi:hypothetical protein
MLAALHEHDWGRPRCAGGKNKKQNKTENKKKKKKEKEKENKTKEKIVDQRHEAAVTFTWHHTVHTQCSRVPLYYSFIRPDHPDFLRVRLDVDIEDLYIALNSVPYQALY